MIRMFTPEEVAYLRWSAQRNAIVQGIALAQAVLVPIALYRVLSPRMNFVFLVLIFALLILGDGFFLAFARKKRERILSDVQRGRVAIAAGPLEAKRRGMIWVNGQEFPVPDASTWKKLGEGQRVTVEYAQTSRIVLRVNDQRQF
jgi:hypothetical protein